MSKSWKLEGQRLKRKTGGWVREKSLCDIQLPVCLQERLPTLISVPWAMLIAAGSRSNMNKEFLSSRPSDLGLQNFPITSYRGNRMDRTMNPKMPPSMMIDMGSIAAIMVCTVRLASRS